MRPVPPNIVNSLTQVRKCDRSSRPMVADEWMRAAIVASQLRRRAEASFALSPMPGADGFLPEKALSLTIYKHGKREQYTQNSSKQTRNSLRKTSMHMDGSIGGRTVQSLDIQKHGKRCASTLWEFAVRLSRLADARY